MNYGRVLNISSCADPDKINVAANYRAKPDAGVFADLDIADNDRVLSDEGGLVNFGSIPLNAFIILQVSV